MNLLRTKAILVILVRRNGCSIYGVVIPEAILTARRQFDLRVVHGELCRNTLDRHRNLPRLINHCDAATGIFIPCLRQNACILLPLIHRQVHAAARCIQRRIQGVFQRCDIALRQFVGILALVLFKAHTLAIAAYRLTGAVFDLHRDVSRNLIRCFHTQSGRKHRLFGNSCVLRCLADSRHDFLCQAP